MKKTDVHLVRGDSTAAALVDAGLSKDQLLVFHDSLSWGPVEGPGRKAFWASMDVPIANDRAQLLKAVEGGDSLTVWPESFLDGMLFALWALASLAERKVALSRVRVPTAMNAGPLYIAESRALNVRDHALASPSALPEYESMLQLWKAFVAGRIGEFYSGAELLVERGVVWALPLRDIVDRVPSRAHGAPPIVEDLLRELATAKEPMPVSRLVGSLLMRRLRGYGMFDTDVVVFRLLRELSNPPNSLVTIIPARQEKYPVGHLVQLSANGQGVLDSTFPLTMSSESILRWIGGHDQMSTPLYFDSSERRVRAVARH
jgi:hypothetical protein